MKNISVMDHSDVFQYLAKKYGEYYFRSSEAVDELQRVWGVDTNRHGVVQGYETETLIEIGGCKGEVRLCETSKKLWLVSINAQTAISGVGSLPSVFDRRGFKTKSAARLAAIAEMIDFFEMEAVTQNSCSSQKNKSEARQCVDALKLKKTPQLSLF